MATINLKGREIPLLYTTQEMLTIQEEIAPLGQIFKLLTGRNPEDENDRSMYAGKQHLDTVGKMIVILGNAALEEAGEKPDLTVKAVLRAIRPADLPEAVNACIEAMGEGMESEYPKEEKTGPVDVVLEEMEKKKETDS